MISFTGSVEVGRLIAAADAKTLKRMNLELCGKTPMIVFDDAALATTLPILVAGVTTFAGQNCMAGSRILVQSGIADQVREHLGERLTRVVVGPGEEKNTQMGPLIDSATVARVDRIVEDSANYAEVIVHGGPVQRWAASLRHLLPAQHARSRRPPHTDHPARNLRPGRHIRGLRRRE
jgi:betaine-aldehyde dehydrogenase